MTQWTRFGLSLAALAALAPAATAAPPDVPTRVPYQGVLLDDMGEPRTGTVDLALRIWDAPTGGTLVYRQEFPGVALYDGVFTVELGPSGESTDIPNDPLTTDLWLALAGDVGPTGPDRFLEVSVDAGTPLVRTQVLVVPYALHAASAETAALAENVSNVDVSQDPDPVLGGPLDANENDIRKVNHVVFKDTDVDTNGGLLWNTSNPEDTQVWYGCQAAESSAGQGYCEGGTNQGDFCTAAGGQCGGGGVCGANWDNTCGIAYNENPGFGGRILRTEHSLDWKHEFSWVPNNNAPQVEQNVNITLPWYDVDVVPASCSGGVCDFAQGEEVTYASGGTQTGVGALVKVGYEDDVVSFGYCDGTSGGDAGAYCESDLDCDAGAGSCAFVSQGFSPADRLVFWSASGNAKSVEVATGRVRSWNGTTLAFDLESGSLDDASFVDGLSSGARRRLDAPAQTGDLVVVHIAGDLVEVGDTLAGRISAESSVPTLVQPTEDGRIRPQFFGLTPTAVTVPRANYWWSTDDGERTLRMGGGDVDVGPNPGQASGRLHVYDDGTRRNTLLVELEVERDLTNEYARAFVSKAHFEGAAPGDQIAELEAGEFAARFRGSQDDQTVGTMVGIGLELRYDHDGERGLVSTLRGMTTDLKLTGKNETIQDAELYRVASPTGFDETTAIDQFRAMHLLDQKGLGETRSDLVLLDAQTCHNPTCDADPTTISRYGNVVFAGGDWDDGHLAFGSGDGAAADHLWRDQGSAVFRVKSGSPESASDGLAVVTASDSANRGPAQWAISDGATHSSGATICLLSGMECTDVIEFSTVSSPSDSDCATLHAVGVKFLAMCR